MELDIAHEMDHLLSIDYFNCQTICPRSVTLIIQGYFTVEATLDTLIFYKEPVYKELP